MKRMTLALALLPLFTTACSECDTGHCFSEPGIRLDAGPYELVLHSITASTCDGLAGEADIALVVVDAYVAHRGQRFFLEADGVTIVGETDDGWMSGRGFIDDEGPGGGVPDGMDEDEDIEVQAVSPQPGSWIDVGFEVIDTDAAVGEVTMQLGEREFGMSCELVFDASLRAVQFIAPDDQGEPGGG